MAEASQQQLLASMKGFLESGDYSDLTITCGNDTYKVHKVVVCVRAGFFARALKFGGKETEQGTIDLPEDEPAIIKLLVQYLYEGEYDPTLPTAGSTGIVPIRENIKRPSSYHFCFPHTCQNHGAYCKTPNVCPHHTCNRPSFGLVIACNNNCHRFNCYQCNPFPLPALNGTHEQLLIHTKMYEMADKYDVVGLKNLVIEKFSRSCQHFWDNTEFAIAAYHAFSTTPEVDMGIRDVISATISAHMDLIEKPEIKVLMRESNGLALAILEGGIKEHGWGKDKN